MLSGSLAVPPGAGTAWEQIAQPKTEKKNRREVCNRIR